MHYLASGLVFDVLDRHTDHTFVGRRGAVTGDRAALQCTSAGWGQRDGGALRARNHAV